MDIRRLIPSALTLLLCHQAVFADPLPRCPDPSIGRVTVALALGGGGARSAAQLGVIRAFEKAGVPIDYISGTSMGAVIGGLYAAGVPVERIQACLLDKHGMFKAFIPSPLVPKIIGFGCHAFCSALGCKRPVGLYATNNVAALVNRMVPPGSACIEGTPIPFVAVATNLLDGQSYPITEGNIGTAVQASSALPGLFKPVTTYPGALLVDGGVRANLPTATASRSNCDIVVAVNVDEDLNVIEPRACSSIRGLTNRLISMVQEEIDNHQMENADIEIRPDLGALSIYSRRPEDVLRAIQAGEDAANEVLPWIINERDRRTAANESEPNSLKATN